MNKTSMLTYSKVYENAMDVEISEDVKEELSTMTKDGPILSIYAKNARALYFFPVTSSILRLSISIYPLTPEIVAKVMTKISEFASKVIYSTGLCLMENKCLWEGFFQKKDLSKTSEEIKLILKEIPEIKEIVLSEVNA
ncbi:MAG: hypothetical protein K9W46_08020 [Candidatus Heimdallarchaeum endolithica]|uniref:Uncharacterized protein n=1 Tax=Candidatus Heimdallarchaeum endolithica TaxID=2876572 RepID=A0A9Y1BQ89_9ARCH|nr:MAG: hypothetical protein K9W46_08020 [Candidatus Heimdallarchaeum endolithica]